jgi:anti-sigma regulatory factor (Ser/Thr protein kinase)
MRPIVLRAELLLDSRIEEIARAREWLKELTSAEGVLDNEVSDLGLAMSEACANIIEHAYRGQPNNPIRLRLTIDETSLVLTIHDRGEKFDLESYVPPELGEPRESGYGVYFVLSLMDKVHYDTSAERGTTLTLIKRRSNPRNRNSAIREDDI